MGTLADMGSPAKRAIGQAHREHLTLGEELARVEARARAGARTPAARRDWQRALDTFLIEWVPRLQAHLAAEERLVEPRLADTLPVETGTLEAFRHERENFADVFSLLRQSRDWLDRREPGAEVEVAAALADLLSLWTAHVRRVDVLLPLLTSLEESSSRSGRPPSRRRSGPEGGVRQGPGRRRVCRHHR